MPPAVFGSSVQVPSLTTRNASRAPSSVGGSLANAVFGVLLCVSALFIRA
ncbi:hypothetical protein SCP_1801700 [Sparassis crispa]|uniref:Uncharacterized protein n=1 Tax=Sparassis crispa TaxID=139825 RepID=A0A401H6S3_9APHY|nr:hypothetical protein SCP_1801700 [Sparassis crispa]GBE90146.1 hypothetical protein SCP_1801700 [Sparassis crispa]